jgi:hypothetical protein
MVKILLFILIYARSFGFYLGACPRTDKGASPLVPSCTVHAPFQPGHHIVFPFLAILGQPPGQMIRLYYGIKMKLMLVISDQNDSKIRPFFRRG